MVPKSGHVTITENLHIKTHVEKFTDSKNAILFDLSSMTKNDEVIAEKTVSEQCERLELDCLELTLVVNTSF